MKWIWAMLIFFMAMAIYIYSHEIVDIQMITHPTELVFVWIKNDKTKETELYVIDYMRYRENMSAKEIMKNNKPFHNN